jgi:hypothetical protein
VAPRHRRTHGFVRFGLSTVVSSILLILLTIFGFQKGPSQYGNIVSLYGSISLAIPPLRQTIVNMRFSRAIKTMRRQQESDQLSAQMVEAAEEARQRAIAEFRVFDLWCYLIGAFLLSAGFFLTILLAEPDRR